jgi:predicted component of type VI protein secretion system
MAVRLLSLDGFPPIPLDRLLVVVGRDRCCDVRIDSLRISRRHCCLALDGEGVMVRDLGSVNGTWLNGERADEGFLRPGDELAIAHLRYRLEFAPETARPQADAPEARAGAAPIG